MGDLLEKLYLTCTIAVSVERGNGPSGSACAFSYVSPPVEATPPERPAPGASRETLVFAYFPLGLHHLVWDA